MSRVREENVLAILDASTTASNPTQHQTNDQIAFLRAVRGAFLVRDYQTHPTNKIYEPVFGIMRMGSSLELILESFRLLCDLHLRFPRVHVLDKDGSESPELVVDEGAWSPFVFSSDVAWSVRQSAGKTSSSPLNSSAFQTLIEELSEVFNDANLQALETKTLGNILLFQYLVRILEEDFVARKRVYDETMNWTLVRDSLLSMLLSSRRINYRSLMKDCFFIICGLCQDCTQSSAGLISSDSSTAKPTTSENTTVAIASLEAVNNIGASLQKLLIIIMELDTLRKKADLEGGITRADGVRTPLLEIILDELTYNRDLLSPFFQKFHHPKWKLEIILQYFSKYNAKPSVRTRRSNSSTEDATFNGVLRCFSNITSTKNIIKKISKDVVQLLLAHGFQEHYRLPNPELIAWRKFSDVEIIDNAVASSCSRKPAFLSLSQGDAERILNSSKDVKGSSLVEICENFISAFTSLAKTDEKTQILPFGKEAVFTAAAILSTKS